jgi:hypothetical protein
MFSVHGRLKRRALRFDDAIAKYPRAADAARRDVNAQIWCWIA